MKKLKSNFGKSTAWMSLGAGVSSVVSFVIFIILSRILAPEDIGLVAFALIIVELGRPIINGTFSHVVIQKPEWDHTFSSTCFYLNLSFSVAVSLVVYFIITPIAGKYFDESVVPILEVFSILLFLGSLKAIHEGKLAREFKFKIIALRTILASLIPGAIGIYLAFKGYGVWALVIQQVLNQLIITLVTLLTANWIPSFTFCKVFALEILRFSSPLMSAQFILNLSSKLFELLIGLIIGPVALAFFRVAGRALFIVHQIVIKPFEHTALSLLSKIEGATNQVATVLKIISLSSFLIMPIFWGIAAISPIFIRLAFGEKWTPSGNLMMILSIGLAPSMIAILVKAVLTANKKSKMVLNIAIWSFVINCCLGLLSVPFGLKWAAIGFTVRSFIVNGINLFWLRSFFDIPLSTIPKIMLPSCTASIIMFFAIQFLNYSIAPYLPLLLTAICLCLFGVLIYFVVMFSFFKTSTQVVLNVALDVSPPKFKLYILTLQRFTNRKCDTYAG